jgi:hypothetical protein
MQQSFTKTFFVLVNLLHVSAEYFTIFLKDPNILSLTKPFSLEEVGVSIFIRNITFHQDPLVYFFQKFWSFDKVFSNYFSISLMVKR